MKIPLGDFRWYAAFHDEGEHPHIHMMAWSAKAGQAYLSKEGIRQIKSKLTMNSLYYFSVPKSCTKTRALIDKLIGENLQKGVVDTDETDTY